MRRALRGVGVAVGFVVVLGLLGCQAVSHVSAQLKDGSLRFVYCDPYSPTELEVWRSTLSANSNPKVTWRSTGTIPLRPGNVISYGKPPAGFETTKGPTAFDPTHSSFDVVFTPTPPTRSHMRRAISTAQSWSKASGSTGTVRSWASPATDRGHLSAAPSALTIGSHANSLWGTFSDLKERTR